MRAQSDPEFRLDAFVFRSMVRLAAVERLCLQRGGEAEGSPGGRVAPPSARRLRARDSPRFVNRRSDEQRALPFLRGVLFGIWALEREPGMMMVLAKALNFRDGSLIVFNCRAAIAVVHPENARHGRAAGDVLR